MITIAVAFVAVEFTNIWLTDEYVLLTFENVVLIQKKGTKKGLIRRRKGLVLLNVMKFIFCL